MMNQSFDLSEAALIVAPEALRDGGSVYLAFSIGNSNYGLRYAGGFADVLSGRDGMLDISNIAEDSPGLFFDPDTIVGLAAFVTRNETVFGRFAEVFLGRCRRTEEQINEVRAWFGREPDI